MSIELNEPLKRRPVNLTIREDVMKQAHALDLNASRAAEHGIMLAIRAAQTQEWLAQNKPALQAHNARVAKIGTLLTPEWAE